MKSLISIIAVILVVILAMGSISSLTESVGSGAGGGSSTTTAATTTAPSSGEVSSDGALVFDNGVSVYPKTLYTPSSNLLGERIAEYSDGVCTDLASYDESNQIFFGTCNNYKTEDLMIACAIDGLEVGKKYIVHLSTYGTEFSFDNIYFRFGNSGNFYSFSVNASDLYITFIFDAQATQLQVGLVLFGGVPSDETLNIYASELKAKTSIELQEMIG